MTMPLVGAISAPEYLQLAGAAALVSVSKTTLRRAIAAGTLPAWLTSSSRTRRVLIRRGDLLAWVERTLVPAATPNADIQREAAQQVADAMRGGRRRG